MVVVSPKSPRWGCSPSRWPKFIAYKLGWSITTGTSPGMILQVGPRARKPLPQTDHHQETWAPCLGWEDIKNPRRAKSGCLTKGWLLKLRKGWLLRLPTGCFKGPKVAVYVFVVIVLYCSLLFFIVLYCSLLFFIVLYCSLLFFIVLYCSLLFFIVLYCSLLFFIVLYCSLLFFVVLCCSLLFFVVLCCSLLFFVVLCCSLLLLLLFRCSKLCLLRDHDVFLLRFFHIRDLGSGLNAATVFLSNV